MWFRCSGLRLRLRGRSGRPLTEQGVLFRSRRIRRKNSPGRPTTGAYPWRRADGALLPNAGGGKPFCRFLGESTMLRLVRRSPAPAASASRPAPGGQPRQPSLTCARSPSVKLRPDGDLLLASPTSHSLKQRFPEARITAVVSRDRGHPAAQSVLWTGWFRTTLLGPRRGFRSVFQPGSGAAPKFPEPARTASTAPSDLVVHLYSNN